MARDEWIPPTQELPHSPPPPPAPGLPEIAEALTIRPGDTLIVRVPAGTRHDTCARMDQGLQQRLPGVEVVILAADGMAVYRPDEQAEVGDA